MGDDLVDAMTKVEKCMEILTEATLKGSPLPAATAFARHIGGDRKYLYDIFRRLEKSGRIEVEQRGNHRRVRVAGIGKWTGWSGTRQKRAGIRIPCMCCGTLFNSIDKTYNRLCAPCNRGA